jgi:hypothetical protein
MKEMEKTCQRDSMMNETTIARERERERERTKEKEVMAVAVQVTVSPRFYR